MDERRISKSLERCVDSRFSLDCGMKISQLLHHREGSLRPEDLPPGAAKKLDLSTGDEE
jgi:hypothetical protein